MRNYTHVDKYLDELLGDVYSQPPDELHTNWAYDVLNSFVRPLPDVKTVLDIGCGEAFCQVMFEYMNMNYLGVCLSPDYENALQHNRNVIKHDFTFLPDEWENTFDLIFARHVLEHSPMPLLTLMEWHRVSKKYLMLVMPNPNHWGYIGRNHFYVLNLQQLRWLLRRSGWRVIRKEHTGEEFRLLCEKMPRISCEGWAESPLEYTIYAEDKDDI